MKRFFSVVLLLSGALALITSSQLRRSASAQEPQWIITPGNQQVALYAKSYALLIGISDYNNGWPKLKGVVDDIKAVNDALKKVGFETEVVMDPTAATLEPAIKSFIARRGVSPNNRLLFYYAGHGHTQKSGYGTDIGYIVPRDAPDPNKDPIGFKARAVSMHSVEVFARQIDAKHALFVFDSCFSGSVFHPTRAIPDVVQEKSGRPVRQFITSGAADQPVPDQSVFRREFVAAITGDAGVGKDGYLTGSQLGAHLEEKVTNYSRRTQTPQYGKIQDPNLDRGDFIFILPRLPPGTTVTIQTAPAPAAPATPASVVANDAEIVFWQSIAASTNQADFKAYLSQYPDGRFAPLARNRIEQAPATQTASVSVAPRAASPAAWRPVSDQVRAFAAARQLPLPANLSIRANDGVLPESHRRFLGAWSSDARWGNGGRQVMIVVQDISTDGSVRLTFSEGPPGPTSFNQSKPRVLEVIGQIEGDEITFRDNSSGFQYGFRFTQFGVIGRALSPPSFNPPNTKLSIRMLDLID